MELRDFIAKTISEIQNEVQLAIDETADVKGAVNPVWGEGNVNRDNVQDVHFDIAVTAIDRESGEGGAGIRVMGVGVDGKLSTSTENSQVSRIQFSIPIIPTGQVIVGSKNET